MSLITAQNIQFSLCVFMSFVWKPGSKVIVWTPQVDPPIVQVSLCKMCHLGALWGLPCLENFPCLAVKLNDNSAGIQVINI